jgi:NADPH:quinone reductase-like Zn-dependent oxidoreductase
MRRVAARGKVQPEVIGHDFAGTVTAVGAAVTQFEVGDEVFGAHKGALRSTSPCPSRPVSCGSRPAQALRRQPQCRSRH